MKTILTLSILSVALAACGSNNTNSAGVNANGTCDSGLIQANNSLVSHGKRLNVYSTREDMYSYDRECQAFSAKYPTSSCKARDMDNGQDLTVNTADIKAKCDHVHTLLYPAPVSHTSVSTPTPTPGPVATPTATPANVKTSEVCTETFISSYNLLTVDLKGIKDAGQNFGQIIIAAQKFDQDCKSFITSYPATVCKAINQSTSDSAEIDSTSIQPTCKQVADYLKSISGGKTNQVLPESNNLLQVIE